MLPNGFTKAALVASLLLGTSALAQAQTHEGTSAPATGPAASSTPATPGGTQMEPQKRTQAEPQKSSQAEPQTTTPNRTGTTNATRQSDVTGHGNSTVESTQNRTSGRSNVETSGSSTEAGKTPNVGAGENESRSSASSSSSATVNLTTTQKTEIHNTIINNHSAPRADNIHISLSVGVTVPPAVRFAPLPENIIAIEPAWRGYDYFLYGEQIVIIEPGTRRIIAILVA